MDELRMALVDWKRFRRAEVWERNGDELIRLSCGKCTVSVVERDVYFLRGGGCEQMHALYGGAIRVIGKPEKDDRVGLGKGCIGRGHE